MCGYCTENIALGVVDDQYWQLCTSLDEFKISIGVHLQEMDDLLLAIRLWQKEDRVEDADIIYEIILCRLLIHLFRQGFDARYQNLIQTDSIRSIITEKCTITDSMQRMLSEFFQDSLESIMPLYDQKAYLERQKWESFFSYVGSFINAYKQALNRYHKWWYLGKNLKVGKSTRPSGNGVIGDALFERDENECKKFKTIFRVLVFAAMLISEQPGPQITIRNIISGDPHYMPDFTGLDLWLQRIAVYHYAPHHKNLFTTTKLYIRLALIWYFAFAKPLELGQRMKLANRIEAKTQKYKNLTNREMYSDQDLIWYLEYLRGYCELSDERRRLAEEQSYLFDDKIKEIDADRLTP